MIGKSVSIAVTVLLMSAITFGNDVPITPPRIDAASNAGELAIGKMRLAPGLKAELFAAEPMIANPVAICCDEKGRIYAIETFRFDQAVFDIRSRMSWLEDELASQSVADHLALLKRKFGPNFRRKTQGPTDRIVVLEDTYGYGKATKSTVFADTFNHSEEGVAASVLVRKGDVYFCDIPNLWLLKDTTGSGRANVLKSLSYGYGVRYNFLGHDLHGLRFGPDGKLYFSIGDRGVNIERSVDGTRLKCLETGAVFRCNPDGSGLEIYATGLRNPQQLAFDAYGDLFTGDNNPDYGDPARWVYVVEGGDNGWRVGYQEARHPIGGGPWMSEHLWEKEDKLTAYSQLPAIGFPGNGPSGVAYYPGTGLPDRYDNHFFMCDFHGGFTGSGVHSLTVVPKGASFQMTDEKDFVWDCLATDICFSPGGGAYVCDWVQGWSLLGKGRIYHIFDPQSMKDPIVAETKKLIADGMTGRSTDELIHLLGHKDMRVRQAAQFELADRGTPSIAPLTTLAQAAGERLPRLHAIWAIGQIAAAQKSNQIAAALLPLLSDKDDEVRAQAEKTLGSLADRDAYEATIRLLSDPSPRVRFFAVMAAGKLEHKDASAALLKLVRDNDDKDAFIRYGAVWALARVDDTAAIAAAAKDNDASVRLAALLVMRRLEDPQVAQFLTDPDPRLVVEAARAINDTFIEPARPALGALLDRDGLDERVIFRAINSNYRLGTPEGAKALASFAARQSAPTEWRIRALELLGQWETPSNLDYVMNLYRPLSQRDPKVARDAVEPVLKTIFASAPDPVKAAAIKLIDALQIKNTSVAVAIVKNPDLSPHLRGVALQLLADHNDPQLAHLIDLCMKDRSVELRADAIRCVGKLPDSTARLQKALGGASIPEQQAIYDALGEVHTDGADKMIADAMDQLLAHKLPAQLWLEVLEDAENRAAPDVHQKYAACESALSPTDHLAKYQQCLEGGDAEAGRKIFRERADVSCIRCHTADGQGGTVGPKLDGIAIRQTRQYMLESIVDPNAKIAPGFESAIVKSSDGRSIVGVVRKDDAQQLVLVDGNGHEQKISKADIVSRETGLSAMPQDISKTLSLRDLRNLVEFLSSLKDPDVKPAKREKNEETVLK